MPEIESVRKKNDSRPTFLHTLPRPDHKGLPASPERSYVITESYEVQ
jgi:hypothetical protein